MNKIYKIAPLSLLLVAVLAGCDGGSSSSSTGGGSDVGENQLASFVKGLADGAVTEEDLEPMFMGDVVTSADAYTKTAALSTDYYGPDWAYYPEYWAETVGVESILETYASYENGVVVTTKDSTIYPYEDDGTEVENANEHIAEEAIEVTGEAVIFEKDDTTHYVYTQNGDVADPYSFQDSTTDPEAMGSYLTENGLGSILIGFSTDAVANWAGYKEAYSSSGDYIVNEEFVAEKSTVEEEAILEVSFTGTLMFPLYSAEALWAEGGEDTFNGIYVDRGLRFGYEYEITNGIITYSEYIFMSYTQYLYVDENYKEGDPTPPEELDEAYLATLDLRPLEDGELMDGDYDYNAASGGILAGLPYHFYRAAGDGKSNGNYDLEKLPDYTLYREQDGSDYGAWFDATLLNGDLL